MRTLVVATRASALALCQTGQVARELEQMHPGLRIQVLEVVTKGDRTVDMPLSQVGGKGLFVSELEHAILRGEADFAVHSLKDVPAVTATGLVCDVIPARIDARDLLITREGRTLDELAVGARIGTSSLRRGAQLLALRPDLRIEPLRGNIDTRLRRLQGLDAIVLAAAGLQRMGWWDGTTLAVPFAPAGAQAFAVDTFVPAIGQGALVLMRRSTDDDIAQQLASVHHAVSAYCVTAERALLADIEGSCQVPVGGHAQVEADGALRLTGVIASPDGRTVVRVTERGTDAVQLGKCVAARLRAEGGAQILQALSLA